MKTYKIVLTGGPCGGKTESLEFLSEKLIEEGFTVNIIEETANSLFKLGYIPNKNISVFDFQNLLFKIQFLKEYNGEGKSKILLCDRGLLDGKVYTSKDDFQKILDINKIDEQNIFKTYDCALYFKSISYDYPNLFIKKRISESPETGMLRDKMCKDIWSKKIIVSNYDNLVGFYNKKKMIYLSLKKQLDLFKDAVTYNLNDYYDKEHIKYIYNGIDTILDKNNISDNLKIKTKGLIK